MGEMLLTGPEEGLPSRVWEVTHEGQGQGLGKWAETRGLGGQKGYLQTLLL